MLGARGAFGLTRRHILLGMVRNAGCVVMLTKSIFIVLVASVLSPAMSVAVYLYSNGLI